MSFFTTPNSKNVIATLRIVTIDRSELTFLLILYFLYYIIVLLYFLYYISMKKLYVIFMYRSLSQSKDEFDHFLLNFEQLISDRMSQNPHFILVTGDFNVRSSSRWKNDLTTSKGS